MSAARFIKIGIGGGLCGVALWYFKLRIWETGLGGDYLGQLAEAVIAGAAIFCAVAYIASKRR